MGRHVVVGAGQVGHRLAELLDSQGHDVTVVSRSGSGPDGVAKVAANVADRERLVDIAKSADVIYNCVNPPYHRWAQDWPPMAGSLLAAAETTGAVLVTLGNLYGYGPVDGPMTEDLPLAATGVKGRVRARMWADLLAAHRAGRVRTTELRASDYFGPGAGEQAFLGDRFVPGVLAGRPVTFIRDTTIPHAWTYLPDVARALAIAGVDERAWGRPWHIPTGPALSARAFGERLAELAGAPAPRIRELPRSVLYAAGMVSPMLRGMRETAYQFDRPYILDSSDFETTFGVTPTPLDDALNATIAWWRDRERSVRQ
jgi:nucleoside-diphosphate-sugar epimerase